ncbi:MAG: diguanylate cyclase [Dethiosulfatibacter sp.]|nr:diguanylate cyclase [Dethiosulfatibacter sp.]
MRNRYSKNRIIIYTLMIVIVILIVSLAQALPTENFRFGQESLYDLNTGWVISSQGNVAINSTLPVKLHLDAGIPYSAERLLEDDFPDFMKLRIRSSMQSIQVLIDGEEIFRDEKPIEGRWIAPEASVWHLVELPANVQGKTLSLIMKSPVKAFSGVVNPVFAGSGDALLFDILNRQITGLVISVLLFLFGMMTIIGSVFLFNTGDNRLLYLGLFAVLVSIWILSEARLMQFFTGNRFIIGGISYMIVALMPIPFLLYLRDAVLTKCTHVVTMVAYLFLLSFFVNLSLQILGIAGFFESLQITNGLMLMTVIFVIALLLVEMIRFKNKQAKRFLLYLSMLMILVFVELVQFFRQVFDSTSFYSRIGLVIFFAFLAWDSIRHFDELLLKDKETQFLKKLAYRDILTGGYNRTVFENDILDLTQGENRQNFRMILMDINSLKSINDKFGHQEGDRVIIKSHQYLVEAFGQNSKCYRLGGDEFACILKSMDISIYEKGVEQIRRRLNEDQKQLPYDMDVAIGSDLYLCDNNMKFSEFFHHIDQLMYFDKVRSKKMANG